MRVKEAARIIGCDTSYVRSLCISGRLPAKKVPYEGNTCGYRWEIAKKDVINYKNKPSRVGRPRKGRTEAEPK